MFSGSHRWRLLPIAAALFAAGSAFARERVLKVCADPNNLPFSNRAGQGFENRIAELIARKLAAKLEYAWWAQRESMVNAALNKGRCDVLMGAPTDMDDVDVTQPYYRSTYVFVSRADRNLSVSSLYDEKLSNLRIGIHVVGDDFAPPGHLLGSRGLAANLRGYSLLGAYGESDPPARLMDAVVKGEVDIAVAWGPLAGYYAKSHPVRLSIAPVEPPQFGAVPFTYEFSIAVRKGDVKLRDELSGALADECKSVRTLLSDYGVPEIPLKGGQTACEPRRSQSAVSQSR